MGMNRLVHELTERALDFKASLTLGISNGEYFIRRYTGDFGTCYYCAFSQPKNEESLLVAIKGKDNLKFHHSCYQSSLEILNLDLDTPVKAKSNLVLA